MGNLRLLKTHSACIESPFMETFIMPLKTYPFVRIFSTSLKYRTPNPYHLKTSIRFSAFSIAFVTLISIASGLKIRQFSICTNNWESAGQQVQLWTLNMLVIHSRFVSKFTFIKKINYMFFSFLMMLLAKRIRFNQFNSIITIFQVLKSINFNIQFVITAISKLFVNLVMDSFIEGEIRIRYLLLNILLFLV